MHERPSRSLAGFTLVELLVVIAIAGILASVAYPSFMAQLQKSRRADAVQALTAVQQAQERWRANNPLYSGSLASINVALPSQSGTYTSQNGYYTISILASPAPTATGYTARAAAVTGTSQASDSGCSTLDVVVTNGTPAPAQASCWSK